MRITEFELAGAYLIEIDPHQDERGFFARTFCAREFEDQGLNPLISQCSTSFSARCGTLRGMHYQESPHQETKLVRCTSGSIFDVIVDLRPESATFRKWRSVELTRDNHKMIYIPPGIAHGFQTLEDDTEVLYQISSAYVPSASRGVRWNDPLLRIKWPITGDVIISDRDAGLPGVLD